MSALISTSPGGARWGQLALRIIFGFVMVWAGWFKFTVITPEAFGESLANSGVPIPLVFAYLVLLLEIVGGALIIIGLFTRPIALLIVVDMIMAILLVSVHIGFMDATGKAGAEVNLLLIGGFLALLFGGAGSLSVDRLLEGEPRPVTG